MTEQIEQINQQTTETVATETPKQENITEEVKKEEVQNEKQEENNEKKEENWGDMIINQEVEIKPQKEVKKDDFYKKKYDESDWVLMFSNPENQPLDDWMIKELLESINVSARGIRKGKTGKCYADFETKEVMEEVVKLSGKVIDGKEIIIGDVPPRENKPKHAFNKKKNTTKMIKKENAPNAKTTKQPKFNPKYNTKTTKTSKSVAKKDNLPSFQTAKKQNDKKKAEEKKEKEDVKSQKKVFKKKEEKIELNEEEKEEGWEINTKGARIGATQKKTKKTELEGIKSRKNYFE